MKNWFKQKQSVAEVVEEIHNSFNCAADQAIKEANRILGNIEPIPDHIEQLKQLGFHSTKAVTEARDKDLKVRLVRDQAEIISYYQQIYPQYKYILEIHVRDICRKYGLVMGKVERYTGEVPKKNIEEISRFHKADPVKKEDRRYMRESHMTSREAEEIDYQSYMNGIENERGYSRTYYRYYQDKDYRICAPVKDMKLDRAEVRDYKIVEIPDPVVLYPVQKGYLVISAWGPEASDENVVNQKMN